MFRRGLRACLEECGFAVVAEAETPDGALEQLTQTEPDLVIMAVDLIGGSGIAACREICVLKPALKVLLMTATYPEEPDLVQTQAFMARASGYVSKRLTEDEWHEAIVQILDGRLVFPDEVIWKAQSKQMVTKRQTEVIALVAQGMTNSEIADRLVISPKTVATHVSNILAKLGVSNRYQAAEVWRQTKI